MLCCAPSAQVLQADGQLVSIEKDLSWWLVAKRFMWQASQGQKNKQRDVPLGRKVGSSAADLTKQSFDVLRGRVYLHGLLCCSDVHMCLAKLHSRRRALGRGGQKGRPSVTAAPPRVASDCWGGSCQTR